MTALQQTCPVARPGGAGPASYRGVLQLDDLLQLQSEATGGHDELMFVVIHQAHELWFKLALFELEGVRDLLLANRLQRAGHLLRRLCVVQALLTEHWAVLDTMLPSDFLEFRGGLEGASGFESVQYREVEFLAGMKDASYLDSIHLTPEDRRTLARRLAEPSVRDAFLAVLAGRGARSPAEVYRLPADGSDLDWSLVDIAERLLDFDGAFATWRARHVLMVERQIGHKPGTGGSTGVRYLRSRLDLRIFPELWEARSTL